MKDTVTIVTGGSQGIGRSIAEFLASKGGDIAIFDIIDGSEVVSLYQRKGAGSGILPCRCVQLPDGWRGCCKGS